MAAALQQIVKYFEGLRIFCLDPHKAAGAYDQSFRVTNGSVTITLDTLNVSLSGLEQGRRGVEEMAAALRESGIGAVTVTDQYRGFNGDAKIYPHNPDPALCNANRPKLAVTLPVNGGSAEKMRAACRSVILGRARAAMRRGMDNAREILSGLESDAPGAFDELLAQLDLSRTGGKTPARPPGPRGGNVPDHRKG